MPRVCLRVPWKWINFYGTQSLLAVNSINGPYRHNKINYLLSNQWNNHFREECTKPWNRNVLLVSACRYKLTTISSVTLTDKDTYLFFMRSTTPKKIMTKSRMPAMTPAILTVWSVCFSGSTASGLWVADPGKPSFKHQNEREKKD